MDGLTNDIIIGQRLFSGFPGKAMSPGFIDLVKTRKVGNVILFAHNIENVTQLHNLCDDIQQLVQEQTGWPALIAIDQEGGMVTRLSNDATNMIGAMALAATADDELAYQTALATGRELRAIGVNFNLAPVLDVNSNSDNPVIGVRSFGDTVETVRTFGLAMAKGYMDAPILCAAKHFPGHGDTDLDSHVNLPVVDKPRERLLAVDLAPFQAAVESGIPAIMTSHILFPQLEPNRLPATMSRTILTDVLRHQMGFSGLIVSDCMEMAAIRQFYGTVAGTEAAFKAGVDMVFISHTAETAAEAVDRVKQNLPHDALLRDGMEESFERIAQAKHLMMQSAQPALSIVGCDEHRRIAANAARRSLCFAKSSAVRMPALGSHPHFIAPNAYRATNASSVGDPSFNFARYMADWAHGTHSVMSIDPDQAEIERLDTACMGASCCIVGTYNGHLNSGQCRLVNQLASTGRPVIAISLRNPYDAKLIVDTVPCLAAFEYTRLAFDALKPVLAGTAHIHGALPVTL